METKPLSTGLERGIYGENRTVNRRSCFFMKKLETDYLICLRKEAGIRAEVLDIAWSTCIMTELYTKDREICDRDEDRNFRKR